MPHSKEERELLAKMGSERNYNRFLRLNRAVYGAIAKKDENTGETIISPGSAKLVYIMELKKAGKSTDNIKDQDVPKYKMSEINGEQLYAIAEGLFTEKVDGVDVVNRERVDEFCFCNCCCSICGRIRYVTPICCRIVIFFCCNYDINIFSCQATSYLIC